MQTGFKITNGVGFHIMFENGYVVSVQFGPGHYCDNFNKKYGAFNGQDVFSTTAEVAIWNEGEYQGLIAMPQFDGDTVGAKFTPKEVLELLNWAASQEPTEKTQNIRNSSPNEEK